MKKMENLKGEMRTAKTENKEGNKMVEETKAENKALRKKIEEVMNKLKN